MDGDARDWRALRDTDGFPLANEDRLGQLHADDLGAFWVCILVPGLGYGWKALDNPRDYTALPTIPIQRSEAPSGPADPL